jgi:hypothetical protein
MLSPSPTHLVSNFKFLPQGFLMPNSKFWAEEGFIVADAFLL